MRPYVDGTALILRQRVLPDKLPGMADQERPGGGPRALGVATAVLLAAVIVWAQPEDADRGLSARTNCQLEIRSRLPDSNASNFDLIGSEVQASPSGFVVTGSVDSRNDAGIKKRRRFRCATDDVGEVLDAQLFEPVVVPEASEALRVPAGWR